MQPLQWPINASAREGTARLFDTGNFYTPSGKARLIPITSQEPLQRLSMDQPLLLNTGRIRDQWHTMTRTGRAPSLFRHRDEPFVELHPEDAKHHLLQNFDLATLSNAQGQFTGSVRITSGQRRGEVFVPMHWTQSFSSEGRCNALIQSISDPISGQPESKQGAVKLIKHDTAWHARLLTRPGVQVNLRGYWARVPLEHSMGYVLADDHWPLNWNDWCQIHLGQSADLQLQTAPEGSFSAVSLAQGRLSWMLLVSPNNQFPDLSRLDREFAHLTLTDRQTHDLLRNDPEARSTQLICSCFQVNDQSIRQAIAAGAQSIESLFETLKCGTNCGSCIPELKALIAQEVEDVMQ